jgi:iron(III) transport system substrate-binding protein
MNIRTIAILSSVTVLALAALAPAPASAQTMTAETRKLLADLKLSPDVLAGLDAELAVPQAWIDAAKKEGVVKVRFPSEEKRFNEMAEVFKARYPGIEIEYTRGTGQQRATAPLIAFKRGTYLSDVLTSWDPMEDEYRAANALDRIDDLPAYKNVPAEYNAEGGIGVAFRLQHYCIGYNTQKVKKEELPKTWDEVLTDKRWHNGRIGMAQNVHVWLGVLWAAKGTAWTNNYLEKIFTVVKPQQRKENLRAYLKLMSLGEYDLAIPAGDFIIRELEDEGMPISMHCPDLIPASAGWLGIMKGNPHPNGAKLFANWVLSKEGQIAGYRANSNIPSHKDMRRREFLPYPDEMMGRKLVIRTPAAQANMENITALWGKYWGAAGSGGASAGGGPR